jgi:hypothetical protein
MINRNKPLVFVTFTLIIAALACSLGGKQEIPLGESFQSDEGGFILQKVDGYLFEHTYGIVSMGSPDAKSNAGPFIMVTGGLMEEVVSMEKRLEELRNDPSGIEVGNSKNFNVDGVDGLLVDLSGVYEGEPVKGKVFFANPKPEQEFNMLGLAPEALWAEIEPIFDGVLKSISFIDAQPFEFSFEDDLLEEDWEPVVEEPETEQAREQPVDAPAAASPYLGEVYDHEEGGFSVRKIKDYDFTDDFGIIQMAKPGLSSYAGPLINIIYDQVEEPMTNEALFAMARDDPSEAGINYFSPVNYVLDGVQGLLVDFDGTESDQGVKGQAFFVMLTPNQYFAVRVIAPEAEWAEVFPMYEAMLASVKFDSGISAAPPTAGGQFIRQWAVRAEASSEYTKDEWSAMQATGAPDVDVCGDDIRAWASADPLTEEHLILYYKTPVNPTELTIYQSYNPSQVVEIQFIDTNGVTHRLWYGDPEALSQCPYAWTHTIELDEAFFTDTVVIFVDQSVLGQGWVEIDAVELVGHPMP